MPSGMLVPAASGAATEGGAVTFESHLDGGVSRLVVPLAAMRSLNGALARAKPGYDPLVAQRIEPEELEVVLSALRALEATPEPSANLELVRAVRRFVETAKASHEAVVISPPS